MEYASEAICRQGLTLSAWFHAYENSRLIAEAAPGDLVEFRRSRMYSHWAVYIGKRNWNGKVVECVIHAGSHGNQQFSSLSVLFCCVSLRKQIYGIGSVVMEPLTDVWGRSKARINNQTDKKFCPLSQQEIVYRAEYCLYDDESREYHIITNNCEHFAKWCRYGVRRCSQIRRVIRKAATCVATSYMVGSSFFIDNLLTDGNIKYGEIEYTSSQDLISEETI